MRSIRDSLYPKLQGLLRANQMTQLDLAKRMRKELGYGSATYIKERFTGKRSWSIADACWILDLFGVKRIEILTYFAPPKAKRGKKTA